MKKILIALLTAMVKSVDEQMVPENGKFFYLTLGRKYSDVVEVEEQTQYLIPIKGLRGKEIGDSFMDFELIPCANEQSIELIMDSCETCINDLTYTISADNEAITDNQRKSVGYDVNQIIKNQLNSNTFTLKSYSAEFQGEIGKYHRYENFGLMNFDAIVYAQLQWGKDQLHSYLGFQPYTFSAFDINF